MTAPIFMLDVTPIVLAVPNDHILEVNVSNQSEVRQEVFVTFDSSYYQLKNPNAHWMGRSQVIKIIESLKSVKVVIEKTDFQSKGIHQKICYHYPEDEPFQEGLIRFYHQQTTMNSNDVKWKLTVDKANETPPNASLIPSPGNVACLSREVRPYQHTQEYLDQVESTVEILKRLKMGQQFRMEAEAAKKKREERKELERVEKERNKSCCAIL